MFNFLQKGNTSHSDSNLFSGGDGSSEQNAVIINATNYADGIDAEYNFIKSKYGMRGVNWKLERQMLNENNSKKYDVMVIKLADGSKQEIYCDITSFFGK